MKVRPLIFLLLSSSYLYGCGDKWAGSWIATITYGQEICEGEESEYSFEGSSYTFTMNIYPGEGDYYIAYLGGLLMKGDAAGENFYAEAEILYSSIDEECIDLDEWFYNMDLYMNPDGGASGTITIIYKDEISGCDYAEVVTCTGEFSVDAIRVSPEGDLHVEGEGLSYLM